MTIDTIIFDLGGTLIEYAGEYAVWPDLETPGFTAVYGHLNRNGRHLPEFEQFKQAGFDRLPGRWQAAMRGEQNLRLVDLLAETLNAVGVTSVPESKLIEAGILYEAAICSQAHPIPHAQETLAQVKAAGYKIGLVSNTMFTGAAHIADLKRFELVDYFDAMLFSADVNKWKPNAAPFEHVLAELGSGAETAVYIGDDPAGDIVGGHRAGMRAVHYLSSQRFVMPDGVQPDAQIRSLTELLPLLSHW
jgi:putative hydrolase of the HAD superfamily